MTRMTNKGPKTYLGAIRKNLRDDGRKASSLDAVGKAMDYANKSMKESARVGSESIGGSSSGVKKKQVKVKKR